MPNGMNTISTRSIRLSQPSKEAAKGAKNQEQVHESKEVAIKSSMMEPKEEPAFADENESPQLRDAKLMECKKEEEEMIDDNEESSHFAMSTSPTHSEFSRSMAPEPVDLKQKQIEMAASIAEKKRKIERIDQKPKNSLVPEPQTRKSSRLATHGGDFPRVSNGDLEPSKKKSRSEAEKVLGKSRQDSLKTDKDGETESSIDHITVTQKRAIPITEKEKLHAKYMANSVGRDSKRDAIDVAKMKERNDELEKRVNDLTIQLVGERREKNKKEKEMENKMKDLTVKLEAERIKKLERKDELDKKMIDLWNQLEEERRAKKDKEDELEKKISELTAQLEDERREKKEKDEQMETKVKGLTVQLEKERTEVSEERMRDRGRIDELTSKLAKYKGTELQQQLELEEGEIIDSDSEEAVMRVKRYAEGPKEVTIRANFTEISELTSAKVCSEPAALSGITWTMSVYQRQNSGKYAFCLEGENENAIEWACPVIVELQFYSQNTDRIVPAVKVRRCFGDHNSSQGLASFNLKKLEEDGYVIDDSIMVAVVIRTYN